MVKNANEEVGNAMKEWAKKHRREESRMRM